MIKYYYHKPLLKYFFAALDQLSFRRSRSKPKSIKKILLVNLGGIGDVLLMEPMIRQIARLWPESQIDVLVDSPAQAVLINDPNLHSVKTFALPWLSHSRPSFWSTLKSFYLEVKSLRLANYDLAFDVKGDPGVILLLTLAKIKYRIGFINSGLSALLQDGYDFYNYQLPRAKLNYLLLSSFWSEWQIEEASPVITLTKAEIAWGRAEKAKLCQSHKKTIAIHLGGGREEKIWPLSYWRELLADLSAYNLLIIGSKSDHNLFRLLNNGQLINGLGYELRQTAGLIGQSDLFVGGDSGPGHLASALGVPVVSIFSLANDPKIWSATSATVITYEPNYSVEQLDAKALELKIAILKALK